MSKYSSVDVKFEIDASDGGSLTDITAYLTAIGDLEVSRETVDATPFGATAKAYLTSILVDYPSFTIEGFYDDTASTGPDAILDIGKVVHTATRSYKLTIGGTKTVSGECWITNYKRTFEVGSHTKFTATLQPTGTPTEA